MSLIDQKLCAWGGVFCATTFGIGLLLAGFLPPPTPTLSPEEIAAVYQGNTNGIRAGMFLSLLGMAGYATFVGVISAQMARMKTQSKLPEYVQLGAGAIGVLTVMFPVMIFAITAFRPERDPQITQMLNDVGWLIIIPAFPTFIAQFMGIAFGTWQDKSEQPIFPRWAGYFNVWVALLFVPGGFAYFVKTGPFAWDGLLAFWVAASAFFIWLVVMTPLLFKAIQQQNMGDSA